MIRAVFLLCDSINNVTIKYVTSIVQSTITKVVSSSKFDLSGTFRILEGHILLLLFSFLRDGEKSEE